MPENIPLIPVTVERVEPLVPELPKELLMAWSPIRERWEEQRKWEKLRETLTNDLTLLGNKTCLEMVRQVLLYMDQFEAEEKDGAK